ncbi:complex I NDUFA9 subunit family protein [Sneathiella sp.]|uniref:complex I NDUFA9 subunit family protein n=1 Tax=Sneathiella sp. TaxID=1964365 RepID=UPI002605DD63|nr:complex I NDUFA9 subunit family protein [Sneathiella sp.]MDF2368774.1 complex I NDUFA9 subunit family protein [Sneathiella sp.]
MSGHLITIFGGSGFIGRHLVGRLAAKGYQIRLAARDPEVAAQLMTQGVVGQVVGFKTNVRNQQSVDRAVAGADIVINLVGVLYEKGAQNFGRLHVDAAERIAVAAKAAGVKQLIHMSALGAHKDHEAAYARSKAVGEELAATEFPGATILRPSVVFGLDDDFFNRFASILSLAPAFPLADGGKMKMQPVWVEDLADAIVRIIETPSQQGKIWELTGPDVYSFKELLEKVLEFTGRKCLLLPVPPSVMSFMARFMALAPGRPQLTPDQVKLLKEDNVASGEFPNLQDLGIQPATINAVVPDYLRRYRRGGGLNSAIA